MASSGNEWSLQAFALTTPPAPQRWPGTSSWELSCLLRLREPSNRVLPQGAGHSYFFKLSSMREEV